MTNNYVRVDRGPKTCRRLFQLENPTPLIERASSSLLVSLLSLLFCAPASLAVEIVPGTIYQGGTTLSSSDFGITTSVPEGWRASLPEGAAALVMERLSGGSVILVAAEASTEAEALAEMSAPQDLGGGAILQPTGTPVRGSDGMLSARYQAVGGQVTGEGAAFARISPSGIGVLFLALDTDGDGAGRRLAEKLARTVGFTKPNPTAPSQTQSTAGAGNASWQNYMRGRYLARFYSGSGYHEKTELWLCSDGSFERSGDAGGYGGAASGAWAGSGRGTWTASGTQPGVGELKLQFANGTSAYALSLENDKLFLDGTQWLRGDNEYCP